MAKWVQRLQGKVPLRTVDAEPLDEQKAKGGDLSSYTVNAFQWAWFYFNRFFLQNQELPVGRVLSQRITQRISG